LPYVNDPWDKTLPPVIEQAEDLFEEPRDYHEFFYDDLPPSSNRELGYQHGLQSEVCRFKDGKHITMAPNCPHFDEYDEMGRKIREGWVAQ